MLHFSNLRIKNIFRAITAEVTVVVMKGGYESGRYRFESGEQSLFVKENVCPCGFVVKIGPQYLPFGVKGN